MKQTIRSQLLQKRKKISANEVTKKSQEITHKLLSLELFRGANTILFYVSYDNEVNTHILIKESLKHGKNVVVPISDVKRHQLKLSQITQWQELALGSYGILEPKKNFIREISLDSVDLAIVPGVGFDIIGNRLGHGKGYYDSLLQDYKGKIVALAFEFQVIENIPVEVHDKKVDVIITEKKVIYC